MVFTIEPMITVGDWRHRLWDDDWTAVTVDGKRTAQFEHTLVVTDDGVRDPHPPLRRALVGRRRPARRVAGGPVRSGARRGLGCPTHMGRRREAWVLAALAPAVFLALDPGGWYPFGPAKWLAVSVLLPLGAAGVIARGRLRADPRLAVAVGALLGFLVLGAAVGLDPTYAWIGTPERQLGVLTWALAALALLVGQSLDPETDGDADPGRAGRGRPGRRRGGHRRGVGLGTGTGGPRRGPPDRHLRLGRVPRRGLRPAAARGRGHRGRRAPRPRRRG